MRKEKAASNEVENKRKKKADPKAPRYTPSLVTKKKPIMIHP
jgi:hypothetical protein